MSHAVLFAHLLFRFSYLVEAEAEEVAEEAEEEAEEEEAAEAEAEEAAEDGKFQYCLLEVEQGNLARKPNNHSCKLKS